MAQKNLSIKLSLNDKQFQSNLRKATRSLKKFGKNMQSTGQAMTRNLTAPILALGGASVKLASDFAETQSKFNTVFRDIQAQANDTAKNLQKNFGLSSRASMQLLSDTGDLLTGFGFTQEEALSLSNQVNELAVDLASFTNFSGGAEGASQALTKALLGERESIKQLGIAITEADLKRFAEEQGLVFKELDRVTKANLTFQLAVKQSGNAIGDHARTSGEFANQTRQLKADVEDLGIQLGQHLLPIAAELLQKTRDLITGFNNLSPETKRLAVGFSLLLAGLGPVLNLTGSLITNLPKIIGFFTSWAGVILLAGSALVYLIENWEAFTSSLAENKTLNTLTTGLLKLAKSVAGNVSPSLDAAITTFQAMQETIEDPNYQKKGVEFMSFGDSMKSAITKVLPFIDEFNNAIGLGKAKSGAALPSVPSKGVKKPMMGGAMQKVSLPDDLKGDVTSLMDVFMNFEEGFKDSLMNTFNNIRQISSQISSLFNQMHQNRMQRLQNEHHLEMQNIENSTLSEEEKEKAKEKLEEKFAKKKKALDYQQAVRAKEMAILDAIVNTAAAIVEALPNVPLSIAVGALGAAQIATIASAPLPAFADGGIVSGPTMGLIGEYPGARTNPEVIAPLDKLQNMIGGSNGAVEVFGSISGADILLSSDRAKNNRTRTRGY